MPNTTAPPRFAALESTEVPAVTTHRDGRTTAGTARTVHAPGVPVPAAAEHRCDSSCGRRP